MVGVACLLLCVEAENPRRSVCKNCGECMGIDRVTLHRGAPVVLQQLRGHFVTERGVYTSLHHVLL